MTPEERKVLRTMFEIMILMLVDLKEDVAVMNLFHDGMEAKLVDEDIIRRYLGNG